MVDYTQITTPPGRFFFGSPFATEDKKNDDGTIRKIWRASIAYHKDDTAFHALYAQLQQIAQAAFPAGEHARPNFSMKCRSCDVPSPQSGTIASQKYPLLKDHFLLDMETDTKPPEVFQVNSAGQMALCTQMDSVLKTGDYVSCQIAVAGNGQFSASTTNVPGIKIYWNGIGLIQQGEAVGGRAPIDGQATFGNMGAVAPAAAVPGLPPAAAVPGVPLAAPAAAVPGVPLAAPAAAVPGVPLAAPAAAVPGVPPAAPAAAVPGVPPAAPAAAIAVVPNPAFLPPT